MSIDIRYITNNYFTGFYVRDSSSAVTTVNLYDKKEYVPENIRDYCNDERPPQFVGPNFARLLGCRETLYPNFPSCKMPEYEGQVCVAEDCILAIDSDWTTCPYFKYDKKE